MASAFPALMVLAVLAAGATGLAVRDVMDPDCPDGRHEADIDPDDPCAGLPVTTQTSTAAPSLAPLQPGEERTFACKRWGGCVKVPIATPAEGATRLQVTVLADMAGAFSARGRDGSWRHVRTDVGGRRLL